MRGKKLGLIRYLFARFVDVVMHASYDKVRASLQSVFLSRQRASQAVWPDLNDFQCRVCMYLEALADVWFGDWHGISVVLDSTTAELLSVRTNVEPAAASSAERRGVNPEFKYRPWQTGP